MQFDVDPATPEKREHPPHPIFGPCLLWPNGWMDEDAVWYVERLACIIFVSTAQLCRATAIIFLSICHVCLFVRLSKLVLC